MSPRFLDVKQGADRESITQTDVQNKMLEGTRNDQREQENRDRLERRGQKPVFPTDPKAVRLAAELGVDLAHVIPTGQDGKQIVEEDVRKAAENPANQLPEKAAINDLTNRNKRDQDRNRDRNRDNQRDTVRSNPNTSTSNASNSAPANSTSTPPSSSSTGTPSTIPTK